MDGCLDSWVDWLEMEYLTNDGMVNRYCRRMDGQTWTNGFVDGFVYRQIFTYGWINNCFPLYFGMDG